MSKTDKINAIVVGDKVYAAVPSEVHRTCNGCDLMNDDECWPMEICAQQDCIFKFSQALTDKLTEKE